MKKIMFLALSALFALAANAQNPDAVKQVKSCDKYKDANEIMKTAAEQMTNQEKAICYNKLVDLALADLSKEEKKYAEWQAKILPDYDPNKYFKKAYAVVKAARDCEKADKEPNDKGQIKPKFRKSNANRIAPARATLVNAGLECYNSHDYEQAAKYFGAFVDSRQETLYEGYTFSEQDNQQYPQICYYTGLANYFAQNYKKAVKYSDITLESGDKELENDAITLKLGALDEQVKAGEIDVEKQISKVKSMLKAYPENQNVFSKLVGLYSDNNMQEEADKMLNKRLKENPSDVMALAYMGQNAQNSSKWSDAIGYYERVLGVKPDFVAVAYNVAACHLNLAGELQDKYTNNSGVIAPDKVSEVRAELEAAKAAFSKMNELDPNEEQTKWKYQLQSVDYKLENLK